MTGVDLKADVAYVGWGIPAAVLEAMAAVCRATDRGDEAEALEARAARIRAIKRRDEPVSPID